MLAQAGPRKTSIAAKPMLIAKTATPQRQGLVIDFNLQGCYPKPSGIVSWWMGEGDASDATGANNGAAYGNPAYPNGEVVQAFGLAGGTSYQHVRIPDAPSLRLTNGITIEAWVYPSNLTVWQNVAAKWDATTLNSPQMAYTMGINPDGKV